MDEILKGNFKVKKQIIEKTKEPDTGAEKIMEEVRKKALSSLGGSMVYMERDILMWDGEKEEETDVKPDGE